MSYSHDHSHDHTHTGSCSHSHHDSHTNSQIVKGYDTLDHNHSQLSHDASSGRSSDTVIDEQRKIILKVDFFNSVKYSMKQQVVNIVTIYPDIVNCLDDQGFSCIHWAAKKGDIELLQLLHEHGAPLNLATSSDAQMLPIHWAASDGVIRSIRFLLDRKQDINAQDANGCTAAVIAAQHNHTSCVIFLCKNGCDMGIVDNNGDTALHWAAYKGHTEMVGLLSTLTPFAIENADIYGQTPVHLAAIRGNLDSLDYLVTVCQSDIRKRDKNGSTPVELSIKKGQAKCEWFLRKFACNNNFFELLKSLDSSSLTNPTYVTYMLIGYNEKEVSNWPWRIVFASNLLASMITIRFVLDMTLSDLYYLHLLGVMLQVVWWIMFYLCLHKSPGFVNDYRAVGTYNTYNEVLDLIGNSNDDDGTFPPVCHTCRVCKPLRSKHCKLQRCCIQKFDHFCPFVGNTVGRDNYKYFVFLLLSHVCAYIVWFTIALYMMNRVRISWLFTFYIMYSLMWQVMILLLLQFHINLLFSNLTTNEQINVMRYPYLKNSLNNYDNPFSKGSRLSNFIDGLFPSSENFYSRQEVLVRKAGMTRSIPLSAGDEERGMLIH